ncbi:MAG: L-2-amino-thiazoline-4-carboxylic acid hydrolase [Burkholderiaceae bacterium]
MDEVQSLREQLKGAMKSRAMLYVALYDEISKEVGADKATAIMQRAIRSRGAALGARFRRHAPADFAALRDDFLGFLGAEPGKPGMFDVEVRRCDASGLDIKFHVCPMKEAWVEAGLDPKLVQTMCAIAGQVDNGAFESAGFELDACTWTVGGEDGCCLLQIRRAEQSSDRRVDQPAG